MAYLSQFTGPQIDSAIRAVRNGMIDASVFRAKITSLTANVSGTVTSLPVEPTVVDLQGGDPLLLINSNGESTYFFVDLLEGEILEQGSSTLPIRDSQGDPVAIVANEQDAVYLEGSILFERFNDFAALIEFQNISISNLSNSLILNNSVGVVGRLGQDYHEVVDQSELLVDLYLDLAIGNKFVLLNLEDFLLVECTVTANVSKGVGVTVEIDPISGSFDEGQPLGLGGETFISSIQLDRDKISLLSSTIASSGAIAEVTSTVTGDNEIPVTGLSVDLKAGAKLELKSPEGEVLGVVELDADIDIGNSPLVLTEVYVGTVPAGSFVHIEFAYLYSAITLDPEQITLIVGDYLSESFVTIESDRVIMETPVFGNAAWFIDGVMSQGIGEEDHINTYSSQEGAWAITGAAHFQFQQNASNYFRSRGQGFEFRGQIYGDTGIIIDDTGHVDDSIGSGPIKSGAIVASKLYKAAQSYSTDLEIVPNEPHSINTIYVSGTYIHPNDGQVIDISANWGSPGDTLVLSSSRNYIFYDLVTQDIEISNDVDVLNRQNILFLATAFLGKATPVPDEPDDIEPPTIFFPVSRSIYGSDSFAAKSISTDHLRANIIETIHLSAASIVGDHISALTTIQIGQGTVQDPGVVLISGTGDYRILSGEDLSNINIDPLNANFRLTNEGQLHATGAVITGTIHASSGSITGPLSVTGSITSPGFYILNDKGLEFNMLEDTAFEDEASVYWVSGENAAYIRGNTVSGTPYLYYQAQGHRLRTTLGAYLNLSDLPNPFGSVLPEEGQITLYSKTLKIECPDISFGHLPTSPGLAGTLWSDNGVLTLA